LAELKYKGSKKRQTDKRGSLRIGSDAEAKQVRKYLELMFPQGDNAFVDFDGLDEDALKVKKVAVGTDLQDIAALMAARSSAASQRWKKCGK